MALKAFAHEDRSHVAGEIDSRRPRSGRVGLRADRHWEINQRRQGQPTAWGASHGADPSSFPERSGGSIGWDPSCNGILRQWRARHYEKYGKGRTADRRNRLTPQVTKSPG